MSIREIITGVPSLQYRDVESSGEMKSFGPTTGGLKYIEHWTKGNPVKSTFEFKSLVFESLLVGNKYNFMITDPLDIYGEQKHWFIQFAECEEFYTINSINSAPIQHCEFSFLPNNKYLVNKGLIDG